MLHSQTMILFQCFFLYGHLLYRATMMMGKYKNGVINPAEDTCAALEKYNPILSLDLHECLTWITPTTRGEENHNNLLLQSNLVAFYQNNTLTRSDLTCIFTVYRHIVLHRLDKPQSFNPSPYLWRIDDVLEFFKTASDEKFNEAFDIATSYDIEMKATGYYDE
jgi:hypothetical protein